MTVADKQERVCVGVVSTAHGVCGIVKVRSFTKNAADFASYGELSDVTGKRHFKVRIKGEVKDQFLVEIAGVTNRDQAEALRGTELYADRDRLPETDEGEFYYADLVGMTAKSPDGKILGVVKAVFNFGAGDMLEISGVREYVPFSKSCIPEIDLAAKTLTVLLPDYVDAEPEKQKKPEED